MKFYTDSENNCHTTNPDGVFQEAEHSFFDGKCDTLIEGYCYEVHGGSPVIYPRKPSDLLQAAQAQYERDQAELLAAYQEGVDSVCLIL